MSAPPSLIPGGVVARTLVLSVFSGPQCLSGFFATSYHNFKDLSWLGIKLDSRSLSEVCSIGRGAWLKYFLKIRCFRLRLFNGWLK